MAKLNKFVKVPLWIIGALFIFIVLFLLLANTIVPPIAISWIEHHDKELLGREIRVKDASLNLFTGVVVIDNAVLYEANDSTPMASFKQLYVDLNMRPLLEKKVITDSIRLYGLRVKVEQDGNRFNFSDIIDHCSTPDSIPADTTPSEWKVVLNNILIDRSYMHYRDVQVGSEFGFTDLSLQIPIINLADIKSKMGLHFDFMRGGSLDTSISIDLEQNLYNLWFDLTRFHLNGTSPYVRQFINISTLNGYLTTRLNIKGRTDHIMDLSVGGQIGIDNLSMVDTKGQTLITIDTLGLEANNIYLDGKLADLNSVYVSGLSTEYIVYKDSSTNLTGLMVEKSEEPADSTMVEVTDSTAVENNAPWVLTVKEINLANLDVKYMDKTMSPEFDFHIHHINASARDFDSRKNNNSAKLMAQLQKKGSLRMEWTGELGGLNNQNLNLRMANLGLESFSPYALQYTAYPLAGGTVTLDSKTSIVNSNLKSKNHILIFHPKAGEKDQNIKPEFKIPLKACLYLLTDMQNKISIDLPVSGNLKDPKFSYRKVIVKEVFNIMLKVLAAPFNAIAHAVGKDNAAVSDILFDIYQRELTATQYEKLDAIAALINARPDLKVDLEQTINYKNAYEGMCIVALKRDYLESHNEEPTYQAMQKLDPKSEKVKMFLWQKVKKAGLKYNADITEDAISLYGEDARKLIYDGVLMRDSLVSAYMTRIGVPDSNYNFIQFNLDSIENYRGANKFIVTLDALRGVEVESAEEIEKEIDNSK